MKSLAAILALAAAAFAASSTLSFDPIFDKAGTPLNDVACSNGPHGLERHGFRTLGDLPNFPHIGGAPAITGWDSPSCGTCWKVTYTNPQGAKKSVNVLAIDTGLKGFNVAKTTMDTLTGGHAESLGRVPVTYSKLDASDCGMKSTISCPLRLQD